MTETGVVQAVVEDHRLQGAVHREADIAIECEAHVDARALIGKLDASSVYIGGATWRSVTGAVMSRRVREQRLRVEKALDALWIGCDGMVGGLGGVALLEGLKVLELAPELHAEKDRGARQARHLQRVLDARDDVPDA